MLVGFTESVAVTAGRWRVEAKVRMLAPMSDQVLAGKVGVVFGVANKRSIAWAIAQAWAKAGAKLFFNYQGERIKGNVEELAGEFGDDTPVWPCDVSRDE